MAISSGGQRHGRRGVHDFTPLLLFDRIETDEANELLVKWEHKMGPINRPFPSQAFALYHLNRPVAVAIHGCLITSSVAGSSGINRDNAIELARLCADRRGLCRIVLRMWREFVFVTLRRRYAVSYQDADLHNGNTYRFDGWKRIAYSRSGSDARSGRKGRNKWVWVWEKPG
jgi:hypothetical protein